MANVKKEATSLDFQIEELRKKIGQKDKDILLVKERMKKEMDLVEFHKNKLKKYSDDLQKLNLEKKGLRMDLMDLRADMAEIDRDAYFENAMTAADKKMTKVDQEEKVDEVEVPAADKKEIQMPLNKEKQVSPDQEHMTPLDKARAEFNKKHPDGFSAVERSKR